MTTNAFPMQADWPPKEWTLPAPDSYVLLNGTDNLDGEPFRLAVTELVAGGYLKIIQVEEPRLLGKRQRHVLTPGEERGRPDALSLAAVWDLLHSNLVQLSYRRSFPGGVTGVDIGDFARAAAEQFGSLVEYARRVVVPALLREGLLEERTGKILWVIPTSRIVLTAAGQAKRQELQQLMWLAQGQSQGWAANDPMMGMQYMMLAGGAMFLMPALLPDFQQIRESASPGELGAVGSLAGWDLAAVGDLEQGWSADAVLDGADGGSDGWGGDGGDAGDGGGASD